MAVIDFFPSPYDPHNGQTQLGPMHLGSDGHPISISLTDSCRLLQHGGIALTRKPIGGDATVSRAATPDGCSNIGAQGEQNLDASVRRFVLQDNIVRARWADFLRAEPAGGRHRVVCHLTAVKAPELNVRLRAGLSPVGPSARPD